MQTAETLVVAQRPAAAESVLKDVLRLNAHVEGAHYLLAQIAEQRGEGAGAERDTERRSGCTRGTTRRGLT